MLLISLLEAQRSVWSVDASLVFPSSQSTPVIDVSGSTANLISLQDSCIKSNVLAVSFVPYPLFGHVVFERIPGAWVIYLLFSNSEQYSVITASMRSL